MQIKTIEKAVIELIHDSTMVQRENIKPESNLISDLSMDSLDRVELCMAVEDEFGIEIPDDVAEQLATVQQVIDKVAELKEKLHA